MSRLVIREGIILLVIRDGMTLRELHDAIRSFICAPSTLAMPDLFIDACNVLGVRLSMPTWTVREVRKSEGTIDPTKTRFLKMPTYYQLLRHGGITSEDALLGALRLWNAEVAALRDQRLIDRPHVIEFVGDETCPICLDHIVPDDDDAVPATPLFLDCGHVFHAACMKGDPPSPCPYRCAQKPVKAKQERVRERAPPVPHNPLYGIDPVYIRGRGAEQGPESALARRMINMLDRHEHSAAQGYGRAAPEASERDAIVYMSRRGPRGAGSARGYQPPRVGDVPVFLGHGPMEDMDNPPAERRVESDSDAVRFIRDRVSFLDRDETRAMMNRAASSPAPPPPRSSDDDEMGFLPPDAFARIILPLIQQEAQDHQEVPQSAPEPEEAPPPRPEPHITQRVMIDEMAKRDHRLLFINHDGRSAGITWGLLWGAVAQHRRGGRIIYLCHNVTTGRALFPFRHVEDSGPWLCAEVWDHADGNLPIDASLYLVDDANRMDASHLARLCRRLAGRVVATMDASVVSSTYLRLWFEEDLGFRIVDLQLPD